MLRSVLSVLLGTVVGLAAAAAAEAATVGQRTSIEGSHTGYVSVDLPAAVDPFSGDDGFQVEGGGHVLGAELRQLRSDYQQPHALLVLRVGPPGNRTLLVSADGGGDLPAGHYQLYLITDSPGRVSLYFPALAGQSALAPAVATPFSGGPLPLRQGNALGTMVFGRTQGIGPAGGLVLVRAIPPSTMGGDRLELCWYAGGDAAAEGSAYGPTCPGGSGYSPRDPAGGAFTLSSPSSQEDYGVGGNYTRLIGPPVQLDTYAMWMSYVLPAGATPPPPGRGRPRTGLLEGMAVLRSRRVVVKRGQARIRLRCPWTTGCRGTVRLSGARRSAHFRLRARHAGVVLVPMKRRVRHRVAHGKRVRARLRLRSRVADGIREERTTVRLVRPAARRRR
jgi:hypothetical protein